MKYDAVEQSHAITQIDETCRRVGIPTYTNLVIQAEVTTALVFPDPKRKPMSEIVTEYVDRMFARDRARSTEEL